MKPYLFLALAAFAFACSGSPNDPQAEATTELARARHEEAAVEIPVEVAEDVVGDTPAEPSEPAEEAVESEEPAESCDFIIDSDQGELIVLTGSVEPAGDELFNVLIQTAPVADPGAVVVRGNVRFFRAEVSSSPPKMWIEYQPISGDSTVLVDRSEPVEAYESELEAEVFGELVAEFFDRSGAPDATNIRAQRQHAAAYTGCGAQTNHHGCDKRNGDQNSCAANNRCPRIHLRLRGECCDTHDACISQNCGAPNNPVDGVFPNQNYPCGAANHARNLNCSADCEACHRAVIGCFIRPRGHSDSACCAAGDCGLPQLCMINGVVITSAATCTANGLGMCVPAPMPMPRPGR